MSKFNAYEKLCESVSTLYGRSMVNATFSLHGHPTGVNDRLDYLPEGAVVVAINQGEKNPEWNFNPDSTECMIKYKKDGEIQILSMPMEELKTKPLEFFRPDLKEQIFNMQITENFNEIEDLMLQVVKNTTPKEVVFVNSVASESGRLSMEKPNVSGSPSLRPDNVKGEAKAEPYPSTIPKIVDHSLRHVLHRAEAYDSEGGERSMSRTVQAFNAFTGHNLSEADGWRFMQCLKGVRLYTNREDVHLNSMEDGIAYSALEAECIVNKGLKDF